jgi:hypothetical protein
MSPVADRLLVTVTFTASRQPVTRAAAGVVSHVLAERVPEAERYITGGCRGGDTWIGRWLLLNRPDAEHVVIVPANHAAVDPWWLRAGRPVTVIDMPAHSAYRHRNSRMVQEADAVFGFPAYLEDDSRSLRSGTWQTIRMAREAGNFSQWQCVVPPYHARIEADPRKLMERSDSV